MSLMLWYAGTVAMGAEWPQWKVAAFFAACYAIALHFWLTLIMALTGNFVAAAAVWTSSFAITLPLAAIGLAGYLGHLHDVRVERAAAAMARAYWRRSSLDALVLYRDLKVRFSGAQARLHEAHANPRGACRDIHLAIEDLHLRLREFEEDPEFMKRIVSADPYR